MKCPVDDTQLVISDRQGVEIDYCPTCRGVWLDRGELDKLIERMSQYGPAAPAHPAPSAPAPSHNEYPRHEERRHYDDDDYKKGYHQDGHHNPHHKKKEGFLGDLFDF